MSINAEIQKLQTNLSNAYLKCSGKGATIPTNQNFDNLANCIRSFTTRSFGIKKEVSSNGVYQFPKTSFTFSLPSNATQVSNRAFSYSFYTSEGLTSVDFSSLTSISGNNNYAFQYAFFLCTNLTSADFSSLTTITGGNAFPYAFYKCENLTSVDFSSLTTASGNSIFNYTFAYCTSLTVVRFPKLESVGATMFSFAFNKATSLTDVYFNALKTTSFANVNAFSNMLKDTGSTTTHTLHFPSNLTSTISGLTGYPTFGGTSGYVTLSFDLPATS